MHFVYFCSFNTLSFFSVVFLDKTLESLIIALTLCVTMWYLFVGLMEHWNNSCYVSKAAFPNSTQNCFRR